MCNLPRSREDRIAIHSDHSHTQRRPHCHSYRSASPTSEQHLHLEPSPSSRFQPPHTMAHERGACTRHDPKIPSEIRCSHLKLSRFGFGFIVNAHRMSSSMAQACSASDEPHCANRVYCFAFARRNAQRCSTKKKRTSRNSAHDRTSPKSLLVNFRLCVRYHPHKFLRQSGLGLHSTPSPSLNVRVSPP